MSSIKTLIDAYIKANNAQEITGPVLNGVLTAIANALETPFIGDDGYWYEYDTETGRFVPTTTKAQGPSGVDAAYAMLVEGGTTPDVQVFYDPDLRQLNFNFYNLKGDKGDTGDPGVIGATATVDAGVGTPSVDTSLVSGLLELDFHNLRGAAAGFGTPTITVGANQGTPTASVTASGPDTAKVFAFAFDGLKGETGPQGPQGPQGNPGSSVDYPFTLANNLTTDDSTVALTAAMGVQLESEISQLESEINGGVVSLDSSDVVSTNTFYNANYELQTFGGTRYLSDYVYVKEAMTLAVSVSCPNFPCLIAFDAGKNVVVSASSSGTFSGDYVVPAGVAYLRFQCETTPYFSVYGEYTGLVSSVNDIDGRVTALEGEVGTISQEMNDPDRIIIPSVATKTVSAMSYFDPLNGAETGFINGSTGAESANSAFIRTTFIPLDGVVSIRNTTPYGSSAGAAFYSDQDISTFISGVVNPGYGTGLVDIPIPTGARYYRTCARTTEISDTIFTVVKEQSDTLTEFLDKNMSVKPRNTHVFYGYENFSNGEKISGTWTKGATPLSASRTNLALAVQDDDAKQIWSNTELLYTRQKFGASFLVNDAASVFSIGFYTTALQLNVLNELRVRNNGGNAIMEIVSGDYNHATVTAITKQCGFSLVAGKVYGLSIQRFEDEVYQGTDHTDGVLFSITSYDDGVTVSEFVGRNLITNNGQSNMVTSFGKGYQFIGLKKGDVTVDNLYSASEYDPQATSILFGDSYVDGATAAEIGGQQVKYGCMLQRVVNGLVLCGLGGYPLSTANYGRDTELVSLFAPKYYIIALGTNNNDFTAYKDALDKLVAFAEKTGIVPVLTTVPPAYSGTRASFIMQANSYVRSSGYRYVDISAAVCSDSDGLVWKTGYVLPDGVHPSALGHQAIYDAFVREFPELINV